MKKRDEILLEQAYKSVLKEQGEAIQLQSPTGNKIVWYFETGQGSQYLLTDKNESKRWKSTHSNTGGEDTGLKNWMSNCVFVDPVNETEGNSGQFLMGNGFKIALSVNDTQGAFYVMDNNKWRLAMYVDAYPKAVKAGVRENKPLAFKLSKQPTMGYNVLEYQLKEDKSVKTVHFGSPVTKIIPANKLTKDNLNKFIQT